MSEDTKKMPVEGQEIVQESETTPQAENYPQPETPSDDSVQLETKGSYPTGPTKPKPEPVVAPPQDHSLQDTTVTGPAPDTSNNDKEKMSFAGRDGTAPINIQPQAEVSDGAPLTMQDNADENKAATTQENTNASEQKEEVTAGVAAKIFNHMAAFAPLYLFFLFLLHVGTSIYFPSTFFPTELQHLALFEKIKAGHQWLLPPVVESLGIAYPGYYWLMGLVDLIPMPETLFLPVLTAITAFIAVFSIYILGRSTNLANNGAFVSVLLLLSCPLFGVFMHMAQPEVLTLGLFCLSLALLYRGWTRETAPFSFIFGFFFLALATLTGGFLPLWTILIASILLIIWRLDIHRAHQLDAVVGFGVLVLTFATWLVLVILTSEHATVLDSIMQQAIVPFMPPYWPLQTPWWTLAILFGALVPWLMAPIFSPWFSILKNSFQSLKNSRTTNSGSTWLYLVGVVGIAILILQKNDAPLAALPLLPVFGLILGKTMANFSKVGSSLFFLILALILLVVGVAITIISIPATASYWTPYCSEQLANALKNIYGLPIISALFIITSLILIRFTQRTSPQGSMLVVALFGILAVQPFTLFVAPSLVNHYTQYHYNGNGLGTLPEVFGIPKVTLPSAPTGSVEPKSEGQTAPQTPAAAMQDGSAPALTPPVTSTTPQTPAQTPAETPETAPTPQEPAAQEAAPAPAPAAQEAAPAPAEPI